MVHRRSISVVSEHPSKSVQVLTVTEVQFPISLLSPSGFMDSRSVFCLQSLKHSHHLSTFSSACSYFPYLAGFQFTHSELSSRQPRSGNGAAQRAGAGLGS